MDIIDIENLKGSLSHPRNIRLMLAVVLCICCLGGCIRFGDLQIARTTISPTFDPRSYDKLAVIVTAQATKDAASKITSGNIRQIENEFIQALLKMNYILASRSDLDRIARERKIQLSVLTEQDAVRFGGWLNTKAILLVNVNIFDRTYAISARMVDTERAQVVWISSYTKNYGAINAVFDVSMSSDLKNIAREMASSLPSRTSPTKQSSDLAPGSQ